MRATHLLGRLAIYYLVIGALVAVAVQFWPDSQSYLPIGGVESLIEQPAKGPLEASATVKAADARP